MDPTAEKAISQQEEISEKLKLIEEEYIEIDRLKVYCGTFNVNGRACDENLNPWLCLSEISERAGDSSIDIYAIGFQELVDLTTTNLLLSSSSVERELAWINSINNVLLNENNFKPPTKYVLVEKLKMFGLFLFVYVRQNLIEKSIVRELYKASVATGLMDMVGNKGSVGLSMRLHETRICFVCSHFASDTEKLEKRNSDYRATKLRLKFQDEQQQALLDLNQLGFDLDDHDFVFWFGDLNYRLDNLPLIDTIKYIFASDYEHLLKFDQLSVERRRQRVFENFQEGKIKFKPTYKYLIKSDLYEKQSLVDSLDPSLVQGKQKLPSWTDRVLWRANNTNLKCIQIQYSSINTITISDHKPVYGLFEVEIKKINKQKYDKLYETMLKDADRKYNDELPHIKVSTYELKFGDDLLFYDMRKEYLTIINSGQSRSNVNILFYEIPTSSSSSTTLCNLPPSCWLSIHPQTIERLEPGASYKVELSTCFSAAHSVLRHLNRAKKLEDFLIVKCVNGNDVFVTASCTYRPTVIGWSLKCLSQFGNGANFNSSDQSVLAEVVEIEIDKYERELDEIFKSRLITNSAEIQKEKLYGLEPTNSTSILNSKLEMYNRTLKDLSQMIIEKDPYFRNDLSAEYKFLMEYLIERCVTVNKNDDSTQTSNTIESSTVESATTKTIEELKNEALVALSSGQFTEFASLKLDLELLIELLYDLLYALPYPLIPRRMTDLCSYACELDYDQAKWILNFMPHSHVCLFELIAKFLGVYIKCFLSEATLLESGLSRLLAEAAFQLSTSPGGLKTSPKKGKLASSMSDINKAADCKAQNAVKFLNLFVSNYGF